MIVVGQRIYVLEHRTVWAVLERADRFRSVLDRADRSACAGTRARVCLCCNAQTGRTVMHPYAPTQSRGTTLISGVGGDKAWNNRRLLCHGPNTTGVPWGTARLPNLPLVTTPQQPVLPFEATPWQPVPALR